MTRKEAIAEIERIIEDNARLLGEAPELVVRFLSRGRVRVYVAKDGRVVRGQYREYGSIDSALKAAHESHRRALSVSGKLAQGWSKAAAINSTPVDSSWTT